MPCSPEMPTSPLEPWQRGRKNEPTNSFFPLFFLHSCLWHLMTPLNTSMDPAEDLEKIITGLSARACPSFQTFFFPHAKIPCCLPRTCIVVATTNQQLGMLSSTLFVKSSIICHQLPERKCPLKENGGGGGSRDFGKSSFERMLRITVKLLDRFVILNSTGSNLRISHKWKHFRTYHGCMLYVINCGSFFLRLLCVEMSNVK